MVVKGGTGVFPSQGWLGGKFGGKRSAPRGEKRLLAFSVRSRTSVSLAIVLYYNSVFLTTPRGACLAKQFLYVCFFFS